jgi:hypothetical protein
VTGKRAMKWIFFSCTLLVALSPHPETARSDEKPQSAAVGSPTERYRYEAIPMNSRESEKELMEVEFVPGKGGIEYHSKVFTFHSSEEISIQMDQEARFLSARRSTMQGPGTLVREERMWRDRHWVTMERSSEGGIKKREVRLPPDQELAVDGSLLALLRFFPFNEGREWKLFMVDFTGYSITVTVHQEGIEKISVPAGEFECYRLDIIVNIPLWKPKITYWLGTQNPHFLVKHEGKRGPFTPTYTTFLVSLE